MRIPSLISFAGFIMIIAATYCPLLRPFHLFNWDAYDMNKPFGMVILLVAVVGIISTVFSMVKVTKLTAWLSGILIVLLLIAAILRVHNEFTFIPIHAVSGFLSKQIKFQWGWYLLFAGGILSLAGTWFSKSGNINKITVLKD